MAQKDSCRGKYKRQPLKAGERGSQAKYKVAHTSARYHQWRRWAVGVLKLNLGGCVDCGYNGHPAALDFDHRPGEIKISGIGLLVPCAWLKILTEIAKCDLVCANCHRIRTYKRRSTEHSFAGWNEPLDV